MGLISLVQTAHMTRCEKRLLGYSSPLMRHMLLSVIHMNDKNWIWSWVGNQVQDLLRAITVRACGSFGTLTHLVLDIPTQTGGTDHTAIGSLMGTRTDQSNMGVGSGQLDYSFKACIKRTLVGLSVEFSVGHHSGLSSTSVRLMET